jgi:hypothetical protein
MASLHDSHDTFCSLCCISNVNMSLLGLPLEIFQGVLDFAVIQQRHRSIQLRLVNRESASPPNDRYVAGMLNL